MRTLLMTVLSLVLTGFAVDRIWSVGQEGRAHSRFGAPVGTHLRGDDSIGTLRLKIVTPDGEPVSRARLLLETANRAHGAREVSWTKVSPELRGEAGYWTLRVLPSGTGASTFDSRKRIVHVPEGEEVTELTITLRKAIGLRVEVAAAEGASLPAGLTGYAMKVPDGHALGPRSLLLSRFHALVKAGAFEMNGLDEGAWGIGVAAGGKLLAWQLIHIAASGNQARMVVPEKLFDPGAFRVDVRAPDGRIPEGIRFEVEQCGPRFSGRVDRTSVDEGKGVHLLQDPDWVDPSGRAPVLRVHAFHEDLGAGSAAVTAGDPEPVRLVWKQTGDLTVQITNWKTWRWKDHLSLSVRDSQRRLQSVRRSRIEDGKFLLSELPLGRTQLTASIIINHETHQRWGVHLATFQVSATNDPIRVTLPDCATVTVKPAPGELLPRSLRIGRTAFGAQRDDYHVPAGRGYDRSKPHVIGVMPVGRCLLVANGAHVGKTMQAFDLHEDVEITWSPSEVSAFLVDRLSKHSILEGLGLRVNDLVIRIDGEELMSNRDLSTAIFARVKDPAVERLALHIERDGERMLLTCDLTRARSPERTHGSVLTGILP